MTPAALTALTDALWPDGDHLNGAQVYWLLDGARDPQISELVRNGRLEYACLYSGILHPRLEAAAPYLVHLSANSPTTNFMLQRGWGNGWGIFVVAQAHMLLTQMRLHFKKLLRAEMQDGTHAVFRYYDPSVLSIYLPTCTNDELRSVFGPVSRFIAEQDTGMLLTLYECEEQSLKIEVVRVGAA